MALLLTKKYIHKGMPINTLYGRVEYNVNMTSTYIVATIHFFYNKDMYREGIAQVMDIEETREYVGNKIPYDPIVDSSDLTTFVHKKLIEILTTDVTYDVELSYEEDILATDEKGDIMLDEKGEPIYAHHMGEPVLDEKGNTVIETRIEKPRLCEVSEITIIDLD